MSNEQCAGAVSPVRGAGVPPVLPLREYGSPDAPEEVYRYAAQCALLRAVEPLVHGGENEDSTRYEWLMGELEQESFSIGLDSPVAKETGAATAQALTQITTAEELVASGLSAQELAFGLYHLGSPFFSSKLNLETLRVFFLLRDIRERSITNSKVALSAINEANSMTEAAMLELVRQIPNHDIYVATPDSGAESSSQVILAAHKSREAYEVYDILDYLHVFSSYKDEKMEGSFKADILSIIGEQSPSDLILAKKVEMLGAQCGWQKSEYVAGFHAGQRIVGHLAQLLKRCSQEKYPGFSHREVVDVVLADNYIREISIQHGVSNKLLSELLYAELENRDWGQKRGIWSRDFTANDSNVKELSEQVHELVQSTRNILDLANDFGGEQGLRELTDIFGITIFSRFESSAGRAALHSQLEQVRSGIISADRIVFLPRSDWSGSFICAGINRYQSGLYFEVGSPEEMNSHIDMLSKQQIMSARLGVYIRGHGTRKTLDYGAKKLTTRSELFGGRTLSEIFPGKECFVYLDSCSNGAGVHVGTKRETWRNNLAAHVADSSGATVIAVTKPDSLWIGVSHEVGETPLSNCSDKKSRFGLSEATKPAQRGLSLPRLLERIYGLPPNPETIPLAEYEEHSTESAVLTLFPKQTR